MFEENKIQDIFRQASVEKEDWLEPSTLVFENIEDAIYKNKRKRWFWFWMTTGLGALLLLGFWQFNTHQLSKESINKTTSTQFLEKEITPEKQNNLAKEEIEANNFQNTETNNKEATNFVDNKSKIESSITKTTNNSIAEKGIKLEKEVLTESEPKLKKLTSKTNISAKPISKTEDYKNNTISSSPVLQNSLKQGISNFKPIVTNSKKQTSIENKADRSSQSAINKGLSIINDDNYVDVNLPVINEIEISTYTEKVPTKQSVKKLNLISPILESDNVDYKITEKLDGIASMLFKQTTTKWSYGIVSGFSYWDYSLNNNYKRLLKPADFDFKNGKGYFVALQAQKTLNKKFSITGNLGFETVYSKSGHNSVVNYDPLNENSDAVSTFDLKMASTMGFIDANIEILRQTDISIDATPVTIDLNNEHEISSFDLSAYLSAKIVTVNNFNASASLGFGVAQIVSIKNELISFTTSLKELSPHKSKITANQTELNKTRPFIGFGAYLTHQIDVSNNLFISYSFKSDLNTLYRSGEFSTFLNKHNVGLGYLKKF